ncbi:MAG: hypothetical protein M1833_004653 [Piccolia ochrophora]|nr:MAG: hypothetical protein M1833_004653 [Piccolia ochrophora]
MAADLPPEELRYQLDHIYEDKGPDCAAFYLVCTVLVIIFVGLRITCRLERKASFGADDWVFFAGATLTLGSFAVLLAYVFAAGLGTHWISLTPEQVILSGKIYYANTILSIVNYPLIKISILLLYKRIFVTPHIRIFAGLGVAFLALFTTACLFTVMFSCIPVRSYWDSTVSARCINTTKFFIAYTLINIGTDLGQKIALYVLFGVGSL